MRGMRQWDPSSRRSQALSAEALAWVIQRDEANKMLLVRGLAMVDQCFQVSPNVVSIRCYSAASADDKLGLIPEFRCATGKVWSAGQLADGVERMARGLHPVALNTGRDNFTPAPDDYAGVAPEVVRAILHWSEEAQKLIESAVENSAEWYLGRLQGERIKSAADLARLIGCEPLMSEVERLGLQALIPEAPGRLKPKRV